MLSGFYNIFCPEIIIYLRLSYNSLLMFIFISYCILGCILTHFFNVKNKLSIVWIKKKFAHGIFLYNLFIQNVYLYFVT